MILTGGCLCGAVRYEATGPTSNATICHCPTCRRASGAANVAWVSVEADHFRVVAGSAASYASSADVTRTFCAMCGTPLTYLHQACSEVIDITVCSLDNPEQLVPQDHTFTSYRLSWDQIADGARTYARTRAEG